MKTTSGVSFTESEDEAVQRWASIHAILGTLWPDSKPLLNWENAFGLLCAVVLSAQCTDEQVNRVTPELKRRWPDPESLSKANPAELEEVVHSTGFYKTKARHLIELSAIISTRHGNRVPDTMEALLELPGVGRKTANLVLSSCFGIPGIIVDTHVIRVATRMGLYPKRDPEDIEARIARIVPVHAWTAFSHSVNRHGKFTCTARAPACMKLIQNCPVHALCPLAGSV